MNIIILLGIKLCLLCTNSNAVLEQSTDDYGNIVWKPSSYRNRNVVPMPPNFDSKKKHKREVDVDDDDDDDVDDATAIRMKPSKKSFIRTHFSIPFGAEFPMGYSEKVQHKGTKKSLVSREPLQEKLGGESNYNILHVTGQLHHSLSRSSVPKTWGLIWKDPPSTESYRASNGYERSTLEGLNKNGKISEEEFDSGLMGRGLGGMRERAQNENLMEEKFAEQLDDESDADNEKSRART